MFLIAGDLSFGKIKADCSVFFAEFDCEWYAHIPKAYGDKNSVLRNSYILSLKVIAIPSHEAVDPVFYSGGGFIVKLLNEIFDVGASVRHVAILPRK